MAKESERRQATVMFADISGFTSMSEQMDPEDVTTIMNDCFDMMGSIITNLGGHIDKFIGDCVMAVFGVPRAIEDAPAKAVSCALEIRKRLVHFNHDRDLVIPLDVHIGINSGMVIAGRVGSSDKKDFTVMGDTVNLASRLEDLSDKAQILIGSETFRYVKQKFTINTLNPTNIKGKSDPVPVYEILSELKITERKEDDACYAISSEFVGRQKELNILELSLLEVINGKGGIVNIIGEAGIGKSRLIAEFIRKCAGRKVFIFEGKSLSMGINISFHPIIYMLKRWIGAKEEESSISTLRKLQRELQILTPEKADEIEPFIATLMNLELPSAMKEKVEGIEGDKLARMLALSMKQLFLLTQLLFLFC